MTVLIWLTSLAQHNSIHIDVNGKSSRFFVRFYLFIWQRERSQVGREAGREWGRSRLPAEQRAGCGAQSQDPEITTWAEGGDLTRWATQVPQIVLHSWNYSSTDSRSFPFIRVLVPVGSCCYNCHLLHRIPLMLGREWTRKKKKRGFCILCELGVFYSYFSNQN